MLFQRNVSGVKREGGEDAGPTLRTKEPVNRHPHECQDHYHHRDHQDQVGRGRGSNSSQIDHSHETSTNRRPHRVGHGGNQSLNGESGVDSTDQRHQQVIQDHRPPGKEAEVRIEPTPNIGISRTRCGKLGCHSAITNGGQHHSHHRQQDGRRGMSVGKLLHDPKERNRRDRHNQNDAVQNEILKAQHAPQRSYSGQSKPLSGRF
jgi:hypothetical protein